MVIILPRYTKKASIPIVFLVVRKIRNKLKIYDFTGLERRPPTGNSSLGAKNLRMPTKQGVCNGDNYRSHAQSPRSYFLLLSWALSKIKSLRTYTILSMPSWELGGKADEHLIDLHAPRYDDITALEFQ